MTCTSPLSLFRWHNPRDNFELVSTLSYSKFLKAKAKGYDVEEIKVPCGQCMSCRLEQSRQTAIRACNEAQMYAHNCFITLTVDDDHMEEIFGPEQGLQKRPFQLFAKRLRKKYSGLSFIERPDFWHKRSWNCNPIRILWCGEYGSQNMRPHYHACIFNFDFEDKILWQVRNGVSIYRSPSLEQLWPYGFSTVGEVNFESAAYLARYVTKKITGKQSDAHYFDSATGVIRNPDFIEFPRGFGLGRLWFEKYKGDVYPSDFMIVKGRKVRPPAYYDRIFDVDNSDVFADIKQARIDKAERAPGRDLRALEKIVEARSRALVRDL